MHCLYVAIDQLKNIYNLKPASKSRNKESKVFTQPGLISQPNIYNALKTHVNRQEKTKIQCKHHFQV